MGRRGINLTAVGVGIALMIGVDRAGYSAHLPIFSIAFAIVWHVLVKSRENETPPVLKRKVQLFSLIVMIGFVSALAIKVFMNGYMATALSDPPLLFVAPMMLLLVGFEAFENRNSGHKSS
jgi:EamA domain-containing membrane protein RarD